MKNVQFILKKPPAINAIYKYTSRGGFARSYISKKGLDWFEESTWVLKQKFGSSLAITQPFRVDIELYSIQNDIDGVIKPLLDLLQKSGVVENDRLVVELRVKKFDVHHRNEEGVIMEIQSLI